MTREEILNTPEIVDFMIDKSVILESKMKLHKRLDELCKLAIKALEQESCEMTAEEYRQRMIQAFHNADCDELIAICVLPIEKEFEHLEWLLKSHYKKEPCDDCISRQAAKRALEDRFIELQKRHDDKRYETNYCLNTILELPPVTRLLKTGHWEPYGNYWEDKFKCSECGKEQPKILCGEQIIGHWSDYCPNCGCHMIESQENEG